MYGVNRDYNFGIVQAICIFMQVHIFMYLMYLMLSELLDKQLFSDSKSDILTNVFTHALVKQNLTNKMTTHSVPVHLSKGNKN